MCQSIWFSLPFKNSEHRAGNPQENESGPEDPESLIDQQTVETLWRGGKSTRSLLASNCHRFSRGVREITSPCPFAYAFQFSHSPLWHRINSITHAILVQMPETSRLPPETLQSKGKKAKDVTQPAAPPAIELSLSQPRDLRPKGVGFCFLSQSK